jgi:hypothetical protein
MVVQDGDNQWNNCACKISYEEFDKLGEELERAGGGAAMRPLGQSEEGRKEEYTPATANRTI